MGLVATFVVGGTLLATVVTLVVGVYAWRNRSVGGATYLALLAAVGSAESLAYAATMLAGDPTTTLVGIRIYRSLLAVGGVLWLAFAATWTDNRWVLAPRYFAPIAAVHLLAIPVMVTGARGPAGTAGHELWWTEAGTTAVGGVVLPAVSYGPAYWGWRLYSALVFLFATALLVEFALRPEQRLYRRRNLLLVAGVVFAFALNVAFQAAGSPFDPTAMGVAVANVLALVAIFGFGFFDVVPVARKRVVGEVDTGMVVYDGTGTLVDVNAAAAGMLGIDDDRLGEDLREVLADTAGVDLDVDPERLAAADPLEAVLDGVEVTVDRNGESRHYDASVSALTDGAGRDIGHSVVFYDVTAQRRRERELDLLKQVLTRVLRHNIRNDLTVIRGSAQIIAEEDDAVDEGAHAERILDTSRSIARISEKARSVQEVLDSEADPRPVELTGAVASAVDSVRERFPRATIETELPGTARASAAPGIEVAIENLVENAVEHNDAAAPWVRVEVETDDGRVEMCVADDGPGIPDYEVAVIERDEETPLEHGSGVGLWLVDWVVERSDGTVEFASTDRGTEVTVRLPPARSGGTDGAAGTRRSERRERAATADVTGVEPDGGTSGE